MKAGRPVPAGVCRPSSTCLIYLPTEETKMTKSFKRLAACLLITIFLFGSLTLTSVEAAMKKPGNNRFIQWDKTDFSACTIAWNRVSGADWYQVRCTWTDGSHNIGGYLEAEYNGVRISGLNYQHVYYAQVRAITTDYYGYITGYSPWSNIVFITPWPRDVSGSVTSRSVLSLKWNIIYGSNGYNVFMSTNPGSSWTWRYSTSTSAAATSASFTGFKGVRFKRYQNYYVRVITRRKRNGVFCTVPEPYKTFYQFKFSGK